MKIFTREEIALWVNVYNLDPSVRLSTEHGNLITTAYLCKMDITVDEIRKILGSPPHPDPVKGAKYIWEPEE